MATEEEVAVEGGEFAEVFGGEGVGDGLVVFVPAAGLADHVEFAGFVGGGDHASGLVEG